MAKLLKLPELMNMRPETAIFIETKKSLRPAFFMGVVDRALYTGDTEYRYRVSLMTPAKIAKEWEWRNYNRTWRLWTAQPSRSEQVGVMWDA